MKIFDGHADIWYDVAQKKKLGQNDIFKKYHLERFKKGEIVGGIFIAYLDHKDDLDDEKQMIQMITSTCHEINTNSDIFNIIKKPNDLDFNNNKMNILMGVEGLRAIGKNLDWLDLLYTIGFRHCSLTWNEENLLATGVGGDSNRGLTQLGIEAIKKIETLGMLLDCSHANEKTFWDIYENSTRPFIASHSNAMKLCEHKRNLTDLQIKAIGEKKGLIGVNAFKNFISNEENKKNIYSYVDHIDYIVSLIGIDHVALGFDFCEYLYHDKKETDSNPIGLENASYAQNVINELVLRGYKNEDIEKIAFKNFLNILKNTLK